MKERLLAMAHSSIASSLELLERYLSRHSTETKGTGLTPLPMLALKSLGCVITLAGLFLLMAAT